MSDYELATLFYQTNANAQAALANYMAAVFGMVAAGYFIARKIDRVSALLLVGLYTLFSAGMGNEIVGLYSDMGRLGAVIAAQAPDATAALGWHGAAGTDGVFFEDVIPRIMIVLLVLTYVGTVWFFARSRRKTEPRDALPSA